MIAKVLIDISVKSLNKVYDYIVPQSFETEIKVGKRVLVNFGNGNGRKIEGIVVKLINENEFKGDLNRLKEMVEILDSDSYLDEDRLKLAKWISKMYFCNVYSAIKLMLPPSASDKLEKKNIVGKQASIIVLSKSEEEIEADISSGKIKSARHVKLLRFIIQNKEAFVDDVISGLDISKNIIKTVKENGYINIDKKDVTSEDYSSVKRTENLLATAEQQKVIDGVSKNIAGNDFKVALLHGVTGSGKTEVYLQIISNCINEGKTAIVLVPEISLTDQTKRRFISRFGSIVSVMHSKMTVTQRQTEYKRIVKGEVKIVIGPRSALFVPLKDIGLIVIDEEHDSSYISQSTPRYNTKEVATRIAYMNSAVLLLGTATPEIATMYKAEEGKLDYYTLNSRPTKYDMPDIEIVDMKEEMLSGKHSCISNRLREEIEKNIQNHEQTFIFLNRRGYSSYLMCADCGKILKCRNCDVNLTYHKKTDLLLCHYCSYCETLKSVCPHCGSEKIIQGGTGTEKIENELKEIFSEVKVLRMDTDTTVKRGSHENILNSFKEKEADILVGTQMISKGHDIENVTLVGIINADSNFAGNDFLVSEKAFSNLLQVSGRAGRGDKKGRVIVQAYDTENYIIQALENQDYTSFYKQEIEFRKLANYPPFVDILLFEVISKYRENVLRDSKIIYDILSKDTGNMYTVYSPKAPYISKINNKYRVQLVLKTKISDKVLDLLYEKLGKYDKIKGRDVTLNVTKNPLHIG